MFKNHLTYKHKLLIMGVFPLIILGVLIGILSYTSAHERVTDSEKSIIANNVITIDAQLTLKARHVNEAIRAASNDLFAHLLFTETDIASSVESAQLSAFSVGLQTSVEAISGIYLIDMSGRVLLNTYQNENLHIKDEMMSELRASAEANPNRILWSGLSYGLLNDDDEPKILAYSAVNSPSGDVLGIYLVEMHPNIFSISTLSNYGSLPRQQVYLLDAQDAFLCGDNSTDDGMMQEISRMFRKGERRFSYTYDNETYFVCGQYNALTGFRTFSLINEKHFFLQSEELKIDIILLVSMSVLGCITVVLFWGNIITKPIQRLNTAMQQARGEDYKLRLSLDNRRDEIGQLSHSFNMMMADLDMLIREVYEQKLLQQAAEMEILQSQINPHFLYNTLDSINWMLIERGAMEESSTVISLGRILRYSMDDSLSLVPLREEISNIKDYLSIHKTRMEERLIYSIDVSADVLDVLVPKLILQPLVENAIRHGIEPGKRQGRLCLQAGMKKENMIISITDDGLGVDAAKLNALRDGSIGIKNVERRMKLSFGDESKLEISGAPGVGTCVRLTFPLCCHLPFTT